MIAGIVRRLSRNGKGGAENARTFFGAARSNSALRKTPFFGVRADAGFFKESGQPAVCIPCRFRASHCSHASMAASRFMSGSAKTPVGWRLANFYCIQTGPSVPYSLNL
ncbi:MAG: hypothetical protein LBE84_11935 [Planctomycetota bacterium]|nr:hypothetical protein [Planctomycetota bacterium]